MRAVLVLAAVLLSACRGTGLPNEGCTHLSRRCHGAVIQVCSTDHAWLTGQDCSMLRPTPKVCDYVEGRFQCVNSPRAN
jgi:hypothetical protein